MTFSGDKTRSEIWDAPVARGPHVLVVWDGGFVRRALPDQGSIVIGRGDDCDVQVVHGSLSRRHVAIHGGAPPRAEDLGSTNGVLLAGRKLEPRTPAAIRAGDAVTAGPVLIVVEDARHASPTSPDDRQPASAMASASAIASEPMAHVRSVLAMIARSEISVLLVGESGAGKEVAAELVHAGSPRAAAPLVRLNCAAFNESLLEGELFGYERGAFTGAVRSKPGLFETARGGTLFLDEVGEMPPLTQAKLLRVIETRLVRRLGGLEEKPLDVRFVAATNKDLRALVATGVFREDLYYRLNGMTLRIPPLRERSGEIATLARLFATQAAARAGRAEVAIDPSALRVLSDHDWPGNIRELRNVVERAVALGADGLLRVEHVLLDGPSSLAAPASRSTAASVTASGLRSDVADYERTRILEALDRTGGNQTKAAELLGLTRRALVTRLETYQLPRPRKK